MKRDEYIDLCNGLLKVVRAEFGYSQERMATALGISKKTLVEIEKGRSSLGWAGSVTFCTIFAQSEILARAFGGKTTDMIYALAFEGEKPFAPKSLKGKIWWDEIQRNNRYVIQQNIISQHYRLLDKDGGRVASSFRVEDLLDYFNQEK